MAQSPLLSSSSTVLWLKVALSALGMLWLYLRYRRSKASPSEATLHSPWARLGVGFAVLFAFAVFHGFGESRSGTFVHHGEMFHYYLGSKYFAELGHYELYNAVIAADAEQGGALAGLPFYTDLRTYQNAPREAALAHAHEVRALFTADRWRAFKSDVGYFEELTEFPHKPALYFFLMDHGYNASPVSTLVLGTLTNLVPVSQLPLLAALDVLLVGGMIALVFGTYGLQMGGLFAVYFFANALNDHDYISGGLLRYDWLLCIVAGVCLRERRRHGASAFFLTLAAMTRVFPAVMFWGLGVAALRSFRATRAVDAGSMRFAMSAGATALGLFLLPAVSSGSVIQPWQEFAAKTALHDDGVYVNHLGLRGMVLFESSHLSLPAFVEAYKDAPRSDIVRHWQDVKEREFQDRKPVLWLCALLALAGLTAILWRRGERAAEALVWPLMLVYVASYPSHYYYAFLCVFILLFFGRANTLAALVPLCILWALNVATLVTDSFGPSPIVFYTLVNIYLFVCLLSIFAFELYTIAFGERERGKEAASAPVLPVSKPKLDRPPRRPRAARRRRG
jgi:hypothetical protein